MLRIGGGFERGFSLAGPDMTTFEHASVCTLDCPDTCSLTVTVEDDRIVKVRGSHALPYTEGVICNKVAHHTGEFVHGPGRLQSPLRRTGPRGSGRFERSRLGAGARYDPCARQRR